MNLKQKIQKSGVPYWRIADRLEIAESTMIRWLRIPEKLESEKVERIEKALKELQREAKS